MNPLKSCFQKMQLALLFAMMVFIIILFTMIIIFILISLLQKTGIFILDEGRRMPLFIFSIFSLVVGTVFAFLFSRHPLKPIRKIGKAVDRIAEGDYSTRIHLKGAEEFRQLSQKFNHMAEELGSVELLRTDFVNNFSHEFKTPMVSIRGFAKMLKRDDLTPEEREEYLDIILSESERLSELSMNILQLSKIEQQTILTNKETYALNEQIRLVIAMLDSKWQAKQMQFSLSGEEVQIDANEDLLKQVWINLIDNAVKFSPDGTEIAIAIAAKKEKIFVTIADHGNGIAPEAQKHIFDKFYQEDTSHATKGNGLGLALCKKIVALHHGKISLLRSDSCGSAFQVVLPALDEKHF